MTIGSCPSKVSHLRFWGLLPGDVTRPCVASHEDFSVGGHARLRETETVLQLQLHANDLPDAIVAEVGVLWREGRLRVDPRYARVQRLVGIRVKEYARRLPKRNLADLALRDEAAQVYLIQVQQG